MIILGIETSCDETSASVLKDGIILSNVVNTQLVHSKYGGVVPSLASKNHEKLINHIVNKAITDSNIKLSDLSGIAVTQGPGLIGSLMVGLNYAKGLSIGLNIPIIGVSHLEGHLFSGQIDSNLKFPYMCLLVSGGHTQIWKLSSFNNYEIISTTVDDAAGEAFDKGARILGLRYPGGPEIEKASKNGNNNKYSFTIPNVKSNPLNFSFSGIKTALLYLTNKFTKDELSIELSNIAASYQECIIDCLLTKLLKALDKYPVDNILIAGGVSANKRFRLKANKIEKNRKIKIYFPDFKYCTDNAAMIAMVGYKKMLLNDVSKLSILPFSSIEHA
ncbi:MAG: tRNA (adenosine(37)-N6)-threonylcarbamoyltransferase complex transferase subunit TsaD [Candidatus Marinimicrobia bacterium]|nr:tRNA (adenosine(37)-N6)-threonylcarbamoyltransferase complex transferase subunit TsaD [Candidatus Neomarinimicrobiota bacterium]